MKYIDGLRPVPGELSRLDGTGEYQVFSNVVGIYFATFVYFEFTGLGMGLEIFPH